MQALIHGDKVLSPPVSGCRCRRGAESLRPARPTQGKPLRRIPVIWLLLPFRHETSRALDPELHTHAFVMNMTQRGMVNGGRLKRMIVRAKMHGDVYKQSWRWS